MKSRYLARIAWAARWMLPPGEAQEVIADYSEIVSDRNCSDRELYREFGSPYSAILLLADRKELRRWLSAFTILTVFLLLGACRAQFLRQVWVRGLDWQELRGSLLLAAPVVSLCLCRRCFTSPGRRISPWLLMGCAVLATAVFGIVLWTRHVFGLIMAGSALPGNIGKQLELWIRGLNVLSCVFALYALVMARGCDRRWLGLYIMALTALVIGASMLWVMKSLNLVDPVGNAIRSMFRMVAVLAALGLAGTGAALLC